MAAKLGELLLVSIKIGSIIIMVLVGGCVHSGKRLKGFNCCFGEGESARRARDDARHWH
jgi:hypothetical protein